MLANKKNINLFKTIIELPTNKVGVENFQPLQFRHVNDKITVEVENFQPLQFRHVNDKITVEVENLQPLQFRQKKRVRQYFVKFVEIGLIIAIEKINGG
jgi:hypothetical protein